MKIIVDGFGGDNAPLEILKGCAMAVDEYGVSITITGKQEELHKIAHENDISLKGIDIEHAPLVMSVCDEPTEILKSMKDSSMAVGLKLLANGQGDAFVTAGSTGAATVGATFIVKRIKGIKRIALATPIPSDNGCYFLIDCGANADCRPEMLTQFAVMGSAYMEKIMNIEKPKVGLVNIGAEPTKGTALQLESYEMLKNAPVNFIGNVEARDLPYGECDVAVADGFTGNVILKLTEGVGMTMYGNIKRIFTKNLVSKLAAMLIMKGLKDFKKKMDYTEYGGAPLMGTSKPVFKAHGSSNAYAIKNAIRQAVKFVDGNVIQKIEEGLALIPNAAD